jgi:hypothetical protein
VCPSAARAGGGRRLTDQFIGFSGISLSFWMLFKKFFRLHDLASVIHPGGLS